MERDLGRGAFVSLAATLPLAMLAVHHGLGHAGDIEFFHEWYLAFRRGASFYHDGPGLNYPILGVLVVCGPSWAIEHLLGRPLDLPTYHAVLEGTLVIAEVGLTLSAAALARTLGARRPRVLAVALYLLPSTWAGGAWFGQIDVVGTALLLTSAWGLARYAARGGAGWLAVGLTATHAALLTKQLTWFAAPALVTLAALGLLRRGDRWAWLAAALSPLAWIAPDPFLQLPEAHRSHLWFVLSGGGSAHGDLAVANGASLWSLIARGGTPAGSIRWLGIGSFGWGWIAFSAVQLGLFARALTRRSVGGRGVGGRGVGGRGVGGRGVGGRGVGRRSVGRRGLDRRSAESLEPRALVLLAGLGQLSMATLLTGVHERYLAHAIPLILLADHDAPRARRWLGWGVGVLSGPFVLASVHPEAFEGPLAFLTRPEPLALGCGAWLLSYLLGRRERSPAGVPPAGAPRPANATERERRRIW